MLRDINYVIHDYTPPNLPKTSQEAVNEVVVNAFTLLGTGTIVLYVAYKFVSADRSRPRPLPPIRQGRAEDQQNLGASSAFITPGRAATTSQNHLAAASNTNQWGDQLTESE